MRTTTEITLEKQNADLTQKVRDISNTLRKESDRLAALRVELDLKNKQIENQKIMMELTTNEKKQLGRIKQGMDEPGMGWLHEVSVFEGKKLSGVISSLVKKGLITSELVVERGLPNAWWVEVVE